MRFAWLTASYEDHEDCFGEAMERYYWTTAEVNIIRQHYPTGGANACMAHLPRRTSSAIYQQATRLGLRYGNKEHKNRKWPADEHIDRAIVEAYHHPERGPIYKQLRGLMRPVWWIKKRAVKLGLSQLVGRKEAPWANEELALLEKHSHKSLKVIARILRQRGYHRTETAIKVKRTRMELSTDDPDHYTGRQLAREFGVDEHVVIRWISQGWLRAGRRGTNRTEANGGDMWWIKRKHVRDFVVENVGVIDIRKVDKVWFVDLLANT